MLARAAADGAKAMADKNPRLIDLAKWMIAISGSKTLIGRPRLREPVFDPCYELSAQIGRDPNTGIIVMIQYFATPLAGLWTWTSTELPPGAILKPVGELSRAEIDALTSAVTKCQISIEQLQANNAGLVLPGGPQ